MIVFLDWCNSLHPLPPDNWWEAPDAFSDDGFDAIENLTVIGWLHKPNMVEGIAELTWLGSYKDLLSTEALKTLRQEVLSPIQCLTVKGGKLTADRVFGE